MRTDRRQFLAAIPGALLAACTARSTARSLASTPAPSPDDDLASAQGAARFIRAHAVATPHGLTWHKSPDEPITTGLDLYHGSAGPALFLLELHRATGEQAALDEALAGAAHIAASWKDPAPRWEIGLFGGFAGHAGLFAALARDSRDPRIAGWLDTAIEGMARAAEPVEGGGVAYAANDMLYGNAGVILTLLELPGDKPRALAVALGDGLLAHAQAVPDGTRWLMSPDDKSEYPNFSHGTAGVAYALARLYEVTRDRRYLDAALGGARHLVAIAHTAGGVCLVPHILPEGAESVA